MLVAENNLSSSMNEETTKNFSSPHLSLCIPNCSIIYLFLILPVMMWSCYEMVTMFCHNILLGGEVANDLSLSMRNVNDINAVNSNKGY